MPWIEAHETSMSNSSDAFVGADGMKPRNRGLSAEITAGAIVGGVDAEHLVGVGALLAEQAAEDGVERPRAAWAPRSSGTGSSRSRFSAYARTDRIICSVVRSTLCMAATVPAGRDPRPVRPPAAGGAAASSTSDSETSTRWAAAPSGTKLSSPAMRASRPVVARPPAAP